MPDLDLDVMLEVEDNEQEVPEAIGAAEADARRIMIRLLVAERKRQRLLNAQQEVLARWSDAITSQNDVIDDLRAWLLDYVRHDGGKSWPDIGSVSMRTLDPKATVTDTKVAEAVAAELGLTQTVVDLAALRAEAVRRLLTDGELLPGVEVETGRETLVVRKQ